MPQTLLFLLRFSGIFCLFVLRFFSLTSLKVATNAKLIYRALIKFIVNIFASFSLLLWRENFDRSYSDIFVDTSTLTVLHASQIFCRVSLKCDLPDFFLMIRLKL